MVDTTKYGTFKDDEVVDEEVAMMAAMQTSNPSYHGHFILVVDADFDYIYYLCPGSTNEVKKMRHENFEVSRKAYGTD